jgi:hypothetical protein
VSGKLLSALREGSGGMSTNASNELEVTLEVSSSLLEHLSEEIQAAIRGDYFFSNGHPGAFVSIERGLKLVQNTGLDFEWVILTRWDVVFYTDYRLDLLSPALFYLPNVCSVAADADLRSCHSLGPMLSPDDEAEYAPDWVFAGSPGTVRAVFIDMLTHFFDGYFEVSAFAFGHKNHGLIGCLLGSLQAQGVISVGRYKYELLDFDFIRELNFGTLHSFDPRLSPHHTAERTQCTDAMESADDIWKLSATNASEHVGHPAVALVCDLKMARGSGDKLGPSCCPSALTYCPCASTAHLSVLTPIATTARPTVESLCRESLRKPHAFAIAPSPSESVADEIRVVATVPCCVVAVASNATVGLTVETIAREVASARSTLSVGRIFKLHKEWNAADLAAHARAAGCFGSQLHGVGAEEGPTSFALRQSVEGATWAAVPSGLRVTIRAQVGQDDIVHFGLMHPPA